MSGWAVATGTGFALVPLFSFIFILGRLILKRKSLFGLFYLSRVIPVGQRWEREIALTLFYFFVSFTLRNFFPFKKVVQYCLFHPILLSWWTSLLSMVWGSWSKFCPPCSLLHHLLCSFSEQLVGTNRTEKWWLVIAGSTAQWLRLHRRFMSCNVYCYRVGFYLIPFYFLKRLLI